MNTDIESLLVDDTPGEVNGERKRLHAARLNSMHLRQPVGQKRMLQLAYEEVERLIEHSEKQRLENVVLGEMYAAAVARETSVGFVRRLWRRFF